MLQTIVKNDRQYTIEDVFAAAPRLDSYINSRGEQSLVLPLDLIDELDK